MHLVVAIVAQAVFIAAGRVFRRVPCRHVVASFTDGVGDHFHVVAARIEDLDLCSGKTWNTYCSQAAYVLPVEGSGGTTYVFMSDRWKGWNLPDSRYIFLPIQFHDDGTLVPLEWCDAWDIDAATGQGTFPAATQPAAGNIALGKTCMASVANEKDGNEAWAAFDGNPRSRWCADDGDYPHWLKVDLGASTAVSRSEIVWEAGRGRIYKYAIESSNDGDLDRASWIARTTTARSRPRPTNVRPRPATSA